MRTGAEDPQAHPHAEQPEASLRRALARAPRVEAQGRAAAPIAPAAPRRVAIALSGGRDSMVLLHALARVRAELGIELAAIHVHHGLCADADAWVAFCERECAARGIGLEVARVHVATRGGESPEAAAREARYAVLLRARADVVALAHHADDQAETVLLQLLRGAGPHGLAAMPERQQRDGAPVLLRPFLGLPATVLEAYARRHALAWVEDPSNRDTALRRNALRHVIVPRLAETFPGVAQTLARAASHQAEAARLLDDLAALDAAQAIVQDARYGPTLDRAAVAALAASRPERARNLLRWFLRRHRLPAPSTARLAALLAQCVSARKDARVRVVHAGATIESHRGRLVVHAHACAPYDIAWHGEARVELSCGTLSASRELAAGIAPDALAHGPLRLVPRRGGERLRTERDGSARNVAALFANAAVPVWERDSWPLLWRGDDLVAVPGIAVDAAFRAGTGEAGYALQWQPRTARASIARLGRSPSRAAPRAPPDGRLTLVKRRRCAVDNAREACA